MLVFTQEEDTELGQRIKSERFRWHNCDWLEMVTGESLYEEEEDQEDEDHFDHYLLHSAAELDNPDYFYSTPSVQVPIGEMGIVDHEGYPLSSAQQYYSTGCLVDGTSAHPTTGVPLPPQNSPLAPVFEGELGMSAAGTGMNFDSTPLDPRSSLAHQQSHSLASPGMLFEREQEQDPSSPLHCTAKQLMPSMEDPLDMYSASFNTSVDLDRDYANSVQDEEIEFAHTYASTEYPSFAAIRHFHGSASGGGF